MSVWRIPEDRVHWEGDPRAILGPGLGRVPVSHAEVLAAEALTRLYGRDGRPLDAEQAFALAEETGLVVPLGAWVLHSACSQGVAWQARGVAPQRIAVNFSARQLAEPMAVARIESVLSETGFDASRLELEITETVAMREDDTVQRALRGLREMSVGIAIDDFGTGYSSLRYLQAFPIDRPKIDREFVSYIPEKASSTAIASAILALARTLEIGVVAEGVEARVQADFLSARGCGELQGDFFDRPASGALFSRLLAADRKRPSRRRDAVSPGG